MKLKQVPAWAGLGSSTRCKDQEKLQLETPSTQAAFLGKILNGPGKIAREERKAWSPAERAIHVPMSAPLSISSLQACQYRKRLMSGLRATAARRKAGRPFLGAH